MSPSVMTRVSLVIVAASAASAFTPVPSPRWASGILQRHNSRVNQLSTRMFSSSSNFDFFPDPEHPRQQNKRSNKRDGTNSGSSNGQLSEQHISDARRQRLQRERRVAAKFVTGDDLHALRHRVLAMRLELQEARRSASSGDKAKMLETAIIEAQQVDAEFVYTVSLERMERAQEAGQFSQAELYRLQAEEARSALPQFNLEGLWVGKYGDHGYEMINVTYVGDMLVAHKVTGTKNVPKGEASFRVDLSPFADPAASEHSNELLDPIELGDAAAEQWGSRYLQRFSGQGHVAAEGFQDSQWIDGQLIIVNKYFSFAWLPIGHQVFFGRPTAELVLKLLKNDNEEKFDDSASRDFLERCWDETELLEDEFDLDEDEDDNVDCLNRIEASMEATESLQPSPIHYNREQQAYYSMEGCFE